MSLNWIYGCMCWNCKTFAKGFDGRLWLSEHKLWCICDETVQTLFWHAGHSYGSVFEFEFGRASDRGFFHIGHHRGDRWHRQCRQTTGNGFMNLSADAPPSSSRLEHANRCSLNICCYSFSPSVKASSLSGSWYCAGSNTFAAPTMTSQMFVGKSLFLGKKELHNKLTRTRLTGTHAIANMLANLHIQQTQMKLPFIWGLACW